jgi:hypothetical protein
MAADAVFMAAIKSGLPHKDALLAMSPAEFLRNIEKFGLMPNWRVQQTQAADYAIRMTQLEPGSPQFDRAVDNLIDVESNRGMQGLTRRIAQQYTTLVDSNGDVDSEFIWIVEGDEATCSPCKANAGLVKTMREWIDIGLPGTPTCDGGDRCRCELFALAPGE